MKHNTTFSEQRFEVFFNLSPDLMCVISGEGYFLEINPAWEKTLGYSQDELKSRHYTSFMLSDDIEKTEKEFAEELEGKDVFNFVNRYVCKNGKIIWLEWHGKASTDRTKAYAVARDVTEKMLLQEITRKQTDAIFQIFENLPFYFNIVVKDLVFRYLNKKCEAFFGMKVEVMTGKKVPEIIGQEAFERVLPYFQRALNGETVEFDNQITDKNNQTRYVHNHFNPYYENTEIAGVASIMEDITERVRAEYEIKKQAGLINLAHDSIIVRDLNSRIIFWNKGAELKYGYSFEEVKNQISYELFKTVFPEPLDDIKARLMQTNYWSGELIQSCKDGKQIVVSSRLQLTRDESGMPVSVFEINTDISRRKEAEARIKQIEARFRGSFELPSIGIAITSPDKKWIEVNSALLTMLGYSRNELEKTTWADLTHPDDLNIDIEQFNRVLTGEIETYSIEKRFLKKNGEILWTIMTAGCVKNQERPVFQAKILFYPFDETFNFSFQIVFNLVGKNIPLPINMAKKSTKHVKIFSLPSQRINRLSGSSKYGLKTYR